MNPLPRTGSAPAPVPFSRRLVWSQTENALAAAERARRSRPHTELLDLTVSNPTTVGLLDGAAAAAVGAALGRTPGRYLPSARGDRRAREAIAAHYAAAGTPVDADRIVLTASSSESYGYLCKLLCDPGDALLVPEPSYPLFGFLTGLEGVSTVPYHLSHDGTRTGRWELELASVDAALATAGPRARGLVVVSPHNPTGSVLRGDDLAALDARAATAGLGIIADEVFADYAARPAPAPEQGGRQRPEARRVRTLAAEDTASLVFSLGGLSKSCGLPHVKLGWIVVGGPAATAAQALDRLDLIADTYLSVSGPVQAALPELLAVGAGIRAAIMARVTANRARLHELTGPASPLTILGADGGWTAIVRVPATRTDEEWALALLAEDGVLVHPGYFFDLRGATYLVLSMLATPDVFAAGVTRLLARVEATDAPAPDRSTLG